MSYDRLDEIKAAFEARGWFLDMQHVAWLIAECERLREADTKLREFANTVVAMCVPMLPPAANPIDPIIAKVLLDLAAAALQEPQ